jgi:thioredoxin 1
MFTRFLKISPLLLALAVSFAVCSPKAEQKTTPPKQGAVTPQKQNAQVTFIELGSVKCIPCKMMQPVMDSIRIQYAGSVEVIFYDVWTPEGSPYAEKYGIQAIPTQVFLDKDGKEFFRHAGFFPKEEIDKIFKQQGL